MKNILRLSAQLSALSLVLLSGCRGWVSDKPPVHLNPNMDTQEKLKPYGASDLFANGRVMQTPPAGTVVRSLAGNEILDDESLKLDKHFVTGLGLSGTATALPVLLTYDMDFMLEGKEKFEIFCMPCHAKDGSGKGTVARRLITAPPTFFQKRIYDLKAGDIFKVITHGKNFPNMASYAKQLSPKERWAVIFYLRSMMMAKDSTLKAFPIADENSEWLVLDDPTLSRFDGTKSEKAKLIEAEIKRILLKGNIEFDVGSSVIKAESISVLTEIYDVFVKNPDVLVRIDGHTDNTGDMVLNQNLSQKRSDSIKKFIVSKGLAADDVFTFGFGSRRAVADNSTNEGRAQNRRIEFQVIDRVN